MATITNPDETATLQACKMALAIVKGEWSFDPDEGVAYLDEVLVKAPNLDRIRAIVRQQLLAITPGTDVLLDPADEDLAIQDGDLVFGRVERIVEVEVTVVFESAQRRLNVDFVAYTTAGWSVRSSVEV